MMSVVGSKAPGGLAFTDTGSITPGGPNAPSSDSGTGGGGPVFSPLEYRAFWDKVAPALKAVDPNVKLIGPATTNPIPISGPSVVKIAGPTNGPNDESYVDHRSYFELLTEPSEPNKPDVISYHGYGGFQGGADTNADLLTQIDTLADDLTGNVLPDTGNVPLWQTEANVNAAPLGASDARAVNQFGAAWWGKLFTVMSQRSPHVQRLYQYVITESPTYDLIWDDTYAGLAGSRAGRPTLPYWQIMNMNRAFPPGSRVLNVTGAPAGTYVLAVATPPDFDHVSVMVVNAPNAAQNVSGTVSIAGKWVTAAKRRVIDASTSMAAGPATTDAGAQNTQPLTLNGYGVSFYEFDT